MSKHHSDDAARAESGKDHKKASILDKLIGRQLRRAREERNLSLKKLAGIMRQTHIMRLTYQQIQKHELGINRMAVVTLLFYSIKLKKPMEFFVNPARRYLEREEFKINIRD